MGGGRESGGVEVTQRHVRAGSDWLSARGSDGSLVIRKCISIYFPLKKKLYNHQRAWEFWMEKALFTNEVKSSAWCFCVTEEDKTMKLMKERSILNNSASGDARFSTRVVNGVIKVLCRRHLHRLVIAWILISYILKSTKWEVQRIAWDDEDILEKMKKEMAKKENCVCALYMD